MECIVINNISQVTNGCEITPIEEENDEYGK